MVALGLHKAGACSALYLGSHFWSKHIVKRQHGTCRFQVYTCSTLRAHNEATEGCLINDMMQNTTHSKLLCCTNFLHAACSILHPYPLRTSDIRFRHCLHCPTQKLEMSSFKMPDHYSNQSFLKTALRWKCNYHLSDVVSHQSGF